MPRILSIGVDKCDHCPMSQREEIDGIYHLRCIADTFDEHKKEPEGGYNFPTIVKIPLHELGPDYITEIPDWCPIPKTGG